MDCNFNNNFNFFVNADIIKSTGEKIGHKDDLDYDNMYLAGIASTEDEDIQNETLSPEGFDLTYIKNKGKVNWNHDQTKIIGEIVDAKIIKGNKLYVKARLLSSSELAKDIYKNAYEMQSDPISSIRLSWSVEGTATKRNDKDNSKVERALITGLALTNTPVNSKETFAEIVKKSLNADAKIFEISDFEKSIYSIKEIDNEFKETLISLKIGIDEYIENITKALEINENLTVPQINEIIKTSKENNIDILKSIAIFETQKRFYFTSQQLCEPKNLSSDLKKAIIYMNCYINNRANLDFYYSNICKNLNIV